MAVSAIGISTLLLVLLLLLLFLCFPEDSRGHKGKNKPCKIYSENERGLGSQLRIQTDKANGRSGRQAGSDVYVCADTASIEASYRNGVSLNPFARRIGLCRGVCRGSSKKDRPGHCSFLKCFRCQAVSLLK